MTSLLARLIPAPRLRTVVLAALFSFSTFAVQAAPTELPLPRPAALAPQPVAALGCADEPEFIGHITSSAGTTAVLAETTTGNVFGYISDVEDDWSCTAYYRYDGLAWTRADLDGVFDWGAIIHSTAVACNWVVGETNYLKANDTTDCADTDAEYAMPVALVANSGGTLLQGIWQPDWSPDELGDFMFIHSDCTSYYEGGGMSGERVRYQVAFGAGEVTNRPGDNCDPTVVDNTGTGQTLVVDNIVPSLNFDWPDESTGPVVIGTNSVSVQFDATDAVAGFGGSDDWDLQRQKATWNGSTCGTFTNDTATGHSTAGVTSALDQVVTQELLDVTCYQWTLIARDENGNTASSITSGSVRTDLTPNFGQRSQHTFESWDLGGGDSLAVNVATRNAVVGHPLFSLPVRGSSLSVNATYNAKDTSNVGMGPGWRLDVFRRLLINADNTVTLTDGDGSRHTFSVPTGSPTVTYTRPATLYATLTRDTAASPDRFTLTYRDLSIDEFEVSGSEALLMRAEDRFGNGVDFAYNGGTTNLATITDTVPSPDRVIDFTWDTGPTPDLLTTVTDWAYVSGGTVQTTNTGSRRAHRFFYDGSGYLKGWADPIDTSGDCASTASHRTCLTYTSDRVATITKTQTYTTESTGTLGTATRTITTTIAYSGSAVSGVTDAEADTTAFTAESPTKLRVDRPTTTTKYGQLNAADQHGRVASVWRVLDISTSLETRTAYDATYPIEPATVTDNYGALESAPARTTTYTYVASSLGLLAKIVEPLTATDDRWTEFTYNANNDVTQQKVSHEGLEPPSTLTASTTTRYCYTTSGCSTSATDLVLRSTIENYDDGSHGGTDGHVEDTVADYQYDAYGQLTGTIRHRYEDDNATPLDERDDRQAFDDKGNVTSEIVNYDDGTVTANSGDTDPAPAVARTDLTSTFTYDTAGNRVSTADPRRAIAAAATTYARDAFGRSVSDGWGSADTGGSWSSTTSDHDIDGSVGTISLGSNTNRNAYLTSVSTQDAEILFKVKVDRLAVGSDHLFWAYLRRQDSSNYYQVRVTFNTTQALTTTFTRTEAATSTVIEAATSSVPHATTDWYWVRARISGTSSVRGQIRLWKDGTTEPVTWAVDHEDTSPPAGLQGSGHVGLRFQLGGAYSGSYPVVASVDELTITSIGGGGQSLRADDFVNRTTYDALDQAITTSTPTTPGLAGTAETATTAYDELGAVRHASDISGLATATLFDQAGRALTVYEDPAGVDAYVIGVMTYDADGKLLTSMDRRQAAEAPDLGKTVYAYDTIGRQLSVTEADNEAEESVTIAEYDGLDRVIATAVGSKQSTVFTFDLGGRTTETDDGFTCKTASHDYRDLLVETVDSADTSTCAPNADSRTLTFTYDGLARLLSAEVTDGPDDNDIVEAHVYDAIGNVLESTSDTGTEETIEFTRDELDQVVLELRPDGSHAKWTHDPAGNIADACSWAAGDDVSDCLPVGTAGWTDKPRTSTSTRWDARNGRIGLTESAGDELTRTTVYDPDENYAVRAIYLPTDLDQTKEHQTIYDYDDQHRLIEITHRLCTISSGHGCSSTTATGSVEYEHDDSDNRSHVVEHNGNTSTNFYYCHDARNQLIGRGSTTVCGTSSIETFAYDDSGNRTQAVEAGVTRNFAYTATGLLCDVETGSAATCAGNVDPDDAGRISDVGGWHFDYDAEARLVSACDDTDCVGSGFDRVDFEYDGEGHRTAITETPAAGTPIVEWTFRYQGDAIVAEYKDDVLHREYVTDDTGTISKVIVPTGADAGDYLVTWNGHGDAMALYQIETNGTLTLANSYLYGTWGRPSTTTHNSIGDLEFRFLYVGAADVQWDSAYGLDLLYMHARHYSPSLGRFLQPDPSRLDEQLFVYAKNGPVTKIDPSGNESFDIFDIPFCVARPIACAVGYSASKWATREAKKRYGDVDHMVRGNAYRHCCWTAQMAWQINPNASADIAEWHEIFDFSQTTQERRMDEHNNRVGVRLGRRVRTGPAVLAACTQAMNRRDLVWKGVRASVQS